MSLGSQVKKYREAFEIGYPELAELSGVEVGTINALEKRSSNRSNYFLALAKAFGLTLEELADEESNHSAKARAHLAFTRRQRQKGHPASEPAPSPYAAPHNAESSTTTTASWWPFPVPAQRARAALTPEDIDRIGAYIQATVEMRESEALKNAA